MKIIILDTETTGTLQEDRICQLSYLVVDTSGNILEVHDDLCTPPLAIKYESMAVHHITPQMIINKPICVDTTAFKRLNELNTNQNLMVIQNAKFDLDMLAKEGFEFKMQLIDTFRVLRAKYPLDGTSHGLQYKRYQWGLYEKEQEIIDKLGVTINAHDALGDVIVLKNLFDKLVGEISIDAMIKLCNKPILLEYMPMGKFKGKQIREIALNERDTLNYMLSKMDLDEDIVYSFNHHLEATAANVVITFGFGKYKGKTPQEIAQEDQNYLFWARDKAQNISKELRAAIEIALAEMI